MDDMKDPAREELEKLIARKGSQQAAADELDVSASFISDLMLGRRDFSRNVLGKLGCERVVVHVKRERLPHLMKVIEKAI